MTDEETATNKVTAPETPAREAMTFDVVIVGAGPAGLSTAIRLKQLAQKENQELSICIIEKAAAVGGHILSGAVLDPRSLTELIPDWRTKGAPLTQSVTEDHFLFLTQKRAFTLPTPPVMKNKGNYIISLGHLVRWLANEAEDLGVEIYPGFAASEVLYHDDGSVKGIATGDMGIGSDGKPTDNYQPGMELYASQTVFAEGCRGSLSEILIKRFNLAKESQHQTYGIGIKEIWEIEPAVSTPGKVVHTIGWPLDIKTYGGGFLYHFAKNRISIGYVVGLDYQNPYLSPFNEFQRYKTHPALISLFENGTRIGYGARALIEGGLQSLPKLSFPGGVLVGDAAGFMNVPRIKGNHTAIKSGMLAAESIYSTLKKDPITHTTTAVEVVSYGESFKKSWAYQELKQVRNIKPAFKWGLPLAILYSGLEDYFLKGRVPWTLKHPKPDHESLKKAAESKKITYPKPDGKITFDRLSSVFLTGTYHEANQPSHLTLKNPEVMLTINAKEYDSPETRYCPAGVYEIVGDGENKRLQINFENCVHCKTCDIKDITQNIVWKTPEGGNGPNYTDM